MTLIMCHLQLIYGEKALSNNTFKKILIAIETNS